jgi:hypothetical protein
MVDSHKYKVWSWNVRNLFVSGSLKTVARELAKYKSNLLGVQIRADGVLNQDILLWKWTGFFIHEGIGS